MSLLGCTCYANHKLNSYLDTVYQIHILSGSLWLYYEKSFEVKFFFPPLWSCLMFYRAASEAQLPMGPKIPLPQAAMEGYALSGCFFLSSSISGFAAYSKPFI